MKLHDLRPAEGSRTERTRVGRGIAAGKGKTAGRGTKGQKARSGGSIAPWFEGGQTPLHVRIPKLRGFKNRFKLDYEVVNVGAIGAAAERGAFKGDSDGGASKSRGAAKSGAAQTTINQDILREAGLVRTLDKPLKILGDGELKAALFVVADAFTASARSKIEAAGGTVNVLEVPTKTMPAIGVDQPAAETQERAATEAPPKKARAKGTEDAVAGAEPADDTADVAADASPAVAIAATADEAETAASADADEEDAADVDADVAAGDDAQSDTGEDA